MGKTIIHIHLGDSSSNNEEILSSLNLLHNKIDTIMGKQEELAALQQQNQKVLSAIDAATTKSAEVIVAIGNGISSLRSQITEAIKSSGLTSEQEEALIQNIEQQFAYAEKLADKSNQVAEALTQIGKSFEEPVPVQPPALEEEETPATPVTPAEPVTEPTTPVTEPAEPATPESPATEMPESTEEGPTTGTGPLPTAPTTEG